MFETILAVLQAGLSIWASKEKTKYLDKFITLKKAYYAEFNKPEEERDDAVLDNCVFEIKLLCHGFASSAGNENLNPPAGPAKP